MYRHPGPYDMYQGHQQPLPYPQHPHDSQQPQVGFNQPAPRQRTAIACRYCRRRKVRLHRPSEALDPMTDTFRSDATDSTLRPTVVAQTAADSIKNASSPPSLPKRTPLCPRIPPIPIYEIRAGCNRRPTDGRSTLNRVSPSSMARTGSRWDTCPNNTTIRIILLRLKAMVPDRAQVHTQVQSTMIGGLLHLIPKNK